MNILILGGYGTFGGRLAELLATEAGLTLIIAGRSLAKAQAFCDRLAPGAKKIALALDRESTDDGGLEQHLAAATPDWLIDASGPFQLYGTSSSRDGADPYRVVKACIKHGVHYMDLADGAAFVQGIAALDSEAKARNVSVLSGVSSFPVLTAAVVRRLAPGLTRIDNITGGIAPSPYAGVGLNVIRAIAGYAGQAVALRRGGQTSTAYALTETLRYTIAPPGLLPLRNLRFSLVDVPDNQVLAQLWPEVQSIWMGAATVPESLHRLLNGLAWLVRLRLLPTLAPLARLFLFTTNHLRWGEHRGGMFVAVQGIDSAARQVRRSWHLVAEGDDGPYIPSMAIEALVRRALDGAPPAPGARACVSELELEDYEAIFAQRTIYTGQREDLLSPAQTTPAQTVRTQEALFRTMLGQAFDSLPQPVRAMHSSTNNFVAHGSAKVERGGNRLARLTALMFGFPQAAESVPVSVAFTVEADGAHASRSGEHWLRTFGSKQFGGRQFSSFLSRGTARAEGLLSERFGPLVFDLALVVDGEKLLFVVRRWRFLGLPLPAALAPTGLTYEFAHEGKFHFHVEIAHPLTGLIVRYRGWLVPGSNPCLPTVFAISFSRSARPKRLRA